MSTLLMIFAITGKVLKFAISFVITYHILSIFTITPWSTDKMSYKCSKKQTTGIKCKNVKKISKVTNDCDNCNKTIQI